MLSKEEKDIICAISNKYKVKKVLLFGSSLEEGVTANDIDLAVEGVPRRDFFKFYGELYFNLSKPVDLVDLSTKSKFNDIIKTEGIVIYG
jgi:predicted nucleotidyltransferase